MSVRQTSPSTNPAPPAPSLAGASGHNLALDGVRGLAILLVMWMHMTQFHAANTIERWYQMLSEFGHTGVDLFFVLSGFLITGILFDSKLAVQAQAGEGKGGGRFFGNFYARRTLRIFPLYYAVVAFSLVLLPHIGEVLRHVVNEQRADLIATKLNRFESVDGYAKWFWLYLSNFPVAYAGSFLHGILGISWSLAIEEQFYLAWPLLVWFLPRRGAIGVCLGLAVAAMACRCVMVGWIFHHGNVYGEPKEWPHWLNPIGVYVLTFCRIDDLALGALAALLFRGSLEVGRAASVARVALPVCGLAALGMAAIDVAVGWSLPKHSVSFGPLYETFGYTLAGLTCLSSLVLAIASRPGGVWHGVWTSRFLRTLGKYAYALYLFHFPIRAVLRDIVFGPGPDAGTSSGSNPLVRFDKLAVGGSELPAQVLFYAVAIGSTLVAAWVSWVLFESQILKLKKFFPSGVEGKAKERRAPTLPG